MYVKGHELGELENYIRLDVYVCNQNKPTHMLPHTHKRTHSPSIFPPAPFYDVFGLNTVQCFCYGQLELFSVPRLFLNAVSAVTLSPISGASGAVA